MGAVSRFLQHPRERDAERRRVAVGKQSRDETQCGGTYPGAVGYRAGGIGKRSVEAHIQVLLVVGLGESGNAVWRHISRC